MSLLCLALGLVRTYQSNHFRGSAGHLRASFGSQQNVHVQQRLPAGEVLPCFAEELGECIVLQHELDAAMGAKKQT